MRHISFKMTTEQIRQGTKDVTRRDGWENVQPGEQLQGVVQSQGLKRGQKAEKLRVIEVVSVRRERVQAMAANLAYGKEEVRREGFADHPTLQFPHLWVAWFCKTHRCTPEKVITRIEFKYVS